MFGVLPKEVYAQLVPEEEPELLSNIVRIFKDIPENCTVDIFGEIYEYFLGNFALAEGKDGGTFYTPATVVRYMVEVLNPEPGDKKFLDPACGSGGMFVQAARYMHRHNASEAEQMKFRCYGVEKEPDTVKLAKMNLLLNNVRGEITEANSFYSDPYNAFGNFDYVMANPPFNVDEVDYNRVSDDTRFNTYGVPRNKTKSAKKKSNRDGEKLQCIPAGVNSSLQSDRNGIAHDDILVGAHDGHQHPSDHLPDAPYDGASGKRQQEVLRPQ
jgi:type I restriction enzyme M protein